MTRSDREGGENANEVTASPDRGGSVIPGSVNIDKCADVFSLAKGCPLFLEE